MRPPGASHGSARSRVLPRARSRPPGRCRNLSSSPVAAPQPPPTPPTSNRQAAPLATGLLRAAAEALPSEAEGHEAAHRLQARLCKCLRQADASHRLLALRCLELQLPQACPLCACRSAARAPSHSRCLGGGICRSRVRAAASGQLLPHRGGNKERLNAAVAELFTHSAGRLPALQARCLPPLPRRNEPRLTTPCRPAAAPRAAAPTHRVDLRCLPPLAPRRRSSTCRATATRSATRRCCCGATRASSTG